MWLETEKGICLQQRDEATCCKKSEVESEATLPAAKMEEGATSQGIQECSRRHRKGEEMDLS